MPCGFTPSYYASYGLTANLNNQSIGSLFGFDAITGQSSYTPAGRLPEGANNFSAHVRDGFGHQSNTVGASFTIDTIPPRFVSISPADNSLHDAPTVNIQGTVDDLTAQVVLEDATSWGSTAPNPQVASFSFPVQLKPGLNVISLTAIDQAGNRTQAVLRMSLAQESVSVTIASPLNGAVITGDSVLVTGSYQGPGNTGITVNGIVAASDGNQFLASVPLQPGQNELTAIATTPQGATATQSVTISSASTGTPLPFSVTAAPQEGMAPLKVAFQISLNSSKQIGSVSTDFDGDRSYAYYGEDPLAPIEFTYNNSGFYKAGIRVSDEMGGTYQFDFPIQVRNYTDMDVIFRSIYQGMLNRLQAGDIDGALSALTGSAYEKYRNIFLALKADLPVVIPQLGVLGSGTIGAELAEYIVVRNSGGVSQAFMIYFLRGEDGVWRIDGM